uniref:Uncharacterized protein n=1 Tax=Tanacetum cinerariifolium TaxID=118510 RepID=A0A6L2M926_TANCI|nr:hypothetical protein [Tanacetum cinerariifolium]
MYGFKECSSSEASYNKSCGCSKGGFVDKFISDPNKTPDSSQQPPHDSLKCGNPVDGLCCRQCVVLRKKLKEVCFTICDEHELFQDFLNIFESSNDNTSIVSASQEPFVFNQDPGENYSQSPPHIDHHCCYGCGDPLDSKFCRRCTSYDRVSKIKDAFRDKQYKSEDMQELIQKLFNDVQNIHEELAEYINTPSWNRPAIYNYDDDNDEDLTIAITTKEPVDTLIIEDEHLDTILAMKSDEVIKSSVEDLVPIPSESVVIPDKMCDVPFRDNSPPLDISKDQFEDFFDSNDDSTLIDNDYFSIDDINYIEASPPDSELVSLDGKIKNDILHEKLLNINLLIAKIESLNDNPTLNHVLETFSNHTEETSSGSTTTYADNSLPKYDSFLFEIDPDQGELTSVVMEDILGEPRVHVPNVLPTYPTLMLDSDFIPSDNSLPKSEIFYFDTKEKNSGSTTIHAGISLPDFNHFHFKIEPDPGELTSIVDSRIRENVLSATYCEFITRG